MRVAFVGVKRKYQELPASYRNVFTKTHLELPYYFARDGGMDVTVTTVDYHDTPRSLFPSVGIDEIDSLKESVSYGTLFHVLESDYVRRGVKFDVVVHWRKWFPEFYRPDAINVINCQDHSFGKEWQDSASSAFAEGKLYGVLCFPTWHKRNLLRECPWLPEERAIDGLTLGVDTDIYRPHPEKDPYELLWASDPGRGLYQMTQIFAQLHAIDKRFRLNVCWPDYCNFAPSGPMSGVTWRGNVANGPELQELFNKSGVLAYPSTFREPSSRAHRQAMAAGSLVLYPPGMGSPSELIVDGRTGVVSDPRTWASSILYLVTSGEWRRIGAAAREYAVSENWAVQAQRFRRFFEAASEVRAA